MFFERKYYLEQLTKAEGKPKWESYKFEYFREYH